MPTDPKSSMCPHSVTHSGSSHFPACSQASRRPTWETLHVGVGDPAGCGRWGLLQRPGGEEAGTAGEGQREPLVGLLAARRLDSDSAIGGVHGGAHTSPYRAKGSTTQA